MGPSPPYFGMRDILPAPEVLLDAHWPSLTSYAALAEVGYNQRNVLPRSQVNLFNRVFVF